MYPLSQVQLILSDLDESLLSPTHTIGERSRVAIARLTEIGLTVALCTGRAPETTRQIAAELGLRYYICNNGASVHDDERILAERLMAASVTAGLAQFFDQLALPVYLMTPQGYFLTRRTDQTDAADAARKVSPILLPSDQWAVPAHKVMAWGGSRCFDECSDRFGNEVHIIYHADYLEIAPKGVSKQWGGEQLAAHLGIPAAQVAAVGDARNDVEMVRWAGIGAAMGNADELLKAIADRVLPGHDQDGTADLFEAILAEKGSG